MKPAQFHYHRPETVAETVELLDEHPHDGELMAGNQSLGIMLSTRLATPDHVIDINRVEDLSRIDVSDGEAWIGATARHREIERSDALAERVPMFPDAARQIAGPSVRNRGTFGGSIGEADPAGNYPCAMAALDGTIHLQSVDGERAVPAREYFIAYMFTDREENELIVGGSVDLDPWPPARTGMAFDELKPAAQTWPTISAGAAVRVDDPAGDRPVVDRATVALANAADIPLAVPEAGSTLEGTASSEEALAGAAAAAREASDPQDEMHADSEFKEEVAGEYARRALEKAYERAIE